MSCRWLVRSIDRCCLDILFYEGVTKAVSSAEERNEERKRNWHCSRHDVVQIK